LEVLKIHVKFFGIEWLDDGLNVTQGKGVLIF